MAKPLPHNIEAEKIVLGAMMTNSSALAQCINSVTVDHFYGASSPNQLVYQAVRNLFDKRLPVDIQTVLEELGLMKESVNAGGIEYLKELLDAVISLSNLDFYLVILQDNKLLRDYLSTIDQIRQNYETEEIDEINQFLARAENNLRTVAERRRIDKFKTALEVSQRVEAELKVIQRADGLTGVDVGYKKINDYTHGLQKGEMTIIAARPSVGKTAFALNLAYNAVKLNPISVAVFSLEMPSEQLVRRLIATDATVSLDNIQTGTRFLNAAQKATVGQSIKNIGNTKLFIDDTPGIKLIDILAKSRQLKAAYDDLGLIVVDYIGLITTGEKRIESRQVEVSNISRALKELARDLKVPVLVISQLSRQVDARDDKRPYLSDLRESGAIEQDADMVFLMYRPGYYKNLGFSKNFTQDEKKRFKEEREKVEALTKEVGEYAELVEIIIAKNRNGKTGIVPLLFFKNFGRFDNPSEDYESRLKQIRQEHGAPDIEE
ncbi:MAG: replicative DNA helicase [Firmicutes bacterium]|nr:replicative DNA helicase [Bacillota bacterium]